jgi:hypothetical protein
VKPLTDPLAEAERHVDQAQQRIEGQLILIERLREDGHDTTEAERLLATFLEVMETFSQHRDQIAERQRKAVRQGPVRQGKSEFPPA